MRDDTRIVRHAKFEVVREHVHATERAQLQLQTLGGGWGFVGEGRAAYRQDGDGSEDKSHGFYNSTD